MMLYLHKTCVLTKSCYGLMHLRSSLSSILNTEKLVKKLLENGKTADIC